MAAAAVFQAAAWRWEQHYRSLEDRHRSLEDRLQRQTEAREALHEAVDARSAARIAEALEAGEPGLLLAVEVKWARKELQAVRAANEQASGTAAAEAEATNRSPEAAPAHPAQDQSANNHCDPAVRKASELVEKALKEDSVEALQRTIDRHRDILPEAVVSKAVKKIPSMQARIEIRKEIARVTKHATDIRVLRNLVQTAQRSTLPKVEISVIENLLQERERERKVRMLSKTATRERPVQLRPEQETKEEPATAAETREEPVAAAETKEEPVTAALKADLLSQDQDRVQAAIVKLKAQGMTARAISRLRLRQ